MEYIILNLIILTNSILFTSKTRKKIEYTIPIVVIWMAVSVYIGGIFDQVNVGVRVVEIISIIATIYNCIYITKRIKSKEIKQDIQIILTPGLFVYLALIMFCIIINKGRIFEVYDEFSHWGLIVKNMYQYNGFGTIEHAFTTFNEYPPFTASFQYILVNIKGMYSEDLIIIAQNILYISIIIPICANADFEKRFKNLSISALAILILPLVFYKDFFGEILVDGFLGILFAMGLYFIYKKDEDDEKYKKIIIASVMTALALTKTTGIVLAIFLLIIYSIKERKLKKIAIVAIVPIILTSAWYIKVETANVQNEWNFEKLLEIPKLDHAKRFIRRIFTSNGTEEQRSLLCNILLLGAYSIYIYQTIEEKQQKSSYVYILIEIIISLIIFGIGLLWMYETIFIKEEADVLASFARYMNTILLTWLTFNTIILMQKKKINLSVIYVFVVISIALMPTKTIYKKYVKGREYINSSYVERNSYVLDFKKYENLYTENDKIYFLSDGGINDIKVLKMCKYETMEERIKNKEARFKGTKEQLENILIEENYTYVYIFKIDGRFVQKFKELFQDKKVENRALYKVNKKESGQVQLEKVKENGINER